MMEETALVDAIKEAACFVSGDLAADLAAARAGGHRLEYVLPNGVTNLCGYVRPPGQPAPADAADAPGQARGRPAPQEGTRAWLPAGRQLGTRDEVRGAWGGDSWSGVHVCLWFPRARMGPGRHGEQQVKVFACLQRCRSLSTGLHTQVLVLGNERFMVPELAFRPSDIGVAQGGIAQAAAEAAAAVHPDLRPLLLANVVAVGGLARCPGFAARLQAELRPLVPDELEARPLGLMCPHCKYLQFRGRE